jgi:hypothetical protein
MLIGIEKKNVELLMQGKPILIDEPALCPMLVGIIYGETIEDICKELGIDAKQNHPSHS